MPTFTGHIHWAAIIFDWAVPIHPPSVCLSVCLSRPTLFFSLSLWLSVSTDILVWCLFGEEIEGMRPNLIGHWWWTFTSYVIEHKKRKRQKMRGKGKIMRDMEGFFLLSSLSHLLHYELCWMDELRAGL